MDIFFKKLQAIDDENTLYIRMTKEDFPGYRKQFKDISFTERNYLVEVVKQDFLKHFMYMKQYMNSSHKD